MILTATLKLHLFCCHYITFKFRKQINSAMRYIMVSLKLVFRILNVITSGQPVCHAMNLIGGKVTEAKDDVRLKTKCTSVRNIQ